MSAVIMVGDCEAIISGTERTDIMVTTDSVIATISVAATCGSTISSRMRSRDAPRLRAASIVPASTEAMAPARSSVTNGVCFHTKAMTMPRQSSKPKVCSGVTMPLATSRLFISPFLARKVRRIWPTTIKGMNSGQR